MLRNERILDEEEAFRLSHEGHQSKLWTAMPGIIQSFDNEKHTCVVQPAISGIVRQPDGTWTNIRMPVLLDCPVCWQGGGGVTLTFPIKPGDECLVVFASRCIDAWWQSGGIQAQAEFRMHDLSDGFVFAGVRSQPNVYSVDTTAAQLRTDDGRAFVEVHPDNYNIRLKTTANLVAEVDGDTTATIGGALTATVGSDVTIDSKTRIDLTAPVITLNATAVITMSGAVRHTNGEFLSSGNITTTADVMAGNISLSNHVHSGVQSGQSDTGAPK